MVSKITILEPHFDGAQFGPTSLTETVDDSAEVEQKDGQSDEGKSRFTTLGQGVLGFIVMFAMLYVGIRILMGGDDE